VEKSRRIYKKLLGFETGGIMAGGFFFERRYVFAAKAVGYGAAA
jgi:hypothetical protein